jgi:tetratricopeptide (TPR) repeat protein
MNCSQLLLLCCSLWSTQEPAPLLLEVSHSKADCRYEGTELSCLEKDHFRIWLNGKELATIDALAARLKELGEGRATMDRKILFRPGLNAPFGEIWSYLVMARKLHCTRFLWGEDKPPVAREGAPQQGPFDLFLRMDGQRLKGWEVQVEHDPWTLKTDAIVAGIRARKVTKDTRIILDVDGNVPWRAVADLAELLRKEGFSRVEFLGVPEIPTLAAESVSEAEAEALGRRLDGATNEEIEAIFDGLLDRQEIHQRFIGSLELSGLIRHLAEGSFDLQRPTGKRFVNENPSQKCLRFLRVRQVQGTCRLLFRFLMPNGLDYLEFILARDAYGRVRIVDQDSLAQGGLATALFRAYLFWDPEHTKILNSLHAPTPGDFVWFGKGPASELMRLVFEKKPQEALAFFRENQEALKGDERAHRVFLNLCRSIGNDEYLEAVRMLEKHFPNTTTLFITKIDCYQRRGELKSCLEAIDALEARVGKDAYLEVHRATAYLSAGKLEEARGSAERATAQDPVLAQAWLMRVAIGLQLKDHKGVAEALTVLEQNLKIPLGSLESEPEFAEFLKSDDYRHWKDARKK